MMMLYWLKTSKQNNDMLLYVCICGEKFTLIVVLELTNVWLLGRLGSFCKSQETPLPLKRSI